MISIAFNFSKKSDEKYEKEEIKMNFNDLEYLKSQSQYFKELCDTSLKSGERISLNNVSRRVFDHIFNFCKLMSENNKNEHYVFTKCFRLINNDKKISVRDLYETCELLGFKNMMRIFE